MTGRRSTPIFLRATTASASSPAITAACGTRPATSLDFSIAPAYYQTNWFRALCVAAFLTMLWAIYRLRVRVLRSASAY